MTTGIRVVTVSASYGAGGSVVGPAVAERLGVPFMDRAIPGAVARLLDVPVAVALRRDEQRPSLMDRMIGGLAGAAFGLAPPPSSPILGADAIDEFVRLSPSASSNATVAMFLSDDDFRKATEKVMRELASRDGAVVLGRAGAVVLANHPGALHVRLHGSRAVRIERVMSHEGLDREQASARVESTDRAWEGYVRHFYKADPRDPALYHLTIDSTVLPLETCVEIVAAAVERRGAAGGGEVP